MRTYGRVTNPDGTKTWVVVSTAPDGDNSEVYLTALVQTLKLNVNESPFYGSWGLPAHQALIQQLPPDFNVMLTQQRYSAYFASLIVSRVSTPPFTNKNPPQYRINALTFQGANLQGPIAQ